MPHEGPSLASYQNSRKLVVFDKKLNGNYNIILLKIRENTAINVVSKILHLGNCIRTMQHSHTGSFSP